MAGYQPVFHAVVPAPYLPAQLVDDSRSEGSIHRKSNTKLCCGSLGSGNSGIECNFFIISTNIVTTVLYCTINHSLQPVLHSRTYYSYWCLHDVVTVCHAYETMVGLLYQMHQMLWWEFWAGYRCLWGKKEKKKEKEKRKREEEEGKAPTSQIQYGMQSHKRATGRTLR